MRFTEPALCAEIDPELFFTDGPGRQSNAAKLVCSRCTAFKECLQTLDIYTSGTDINGVQAGMTIRERK